MAASSRITSHVTKLESFQTGFFRMTMTQMSSTVNICQSIKEHLWDVVESNLGQLCDAGTNELCLIMCGNVIMSHLNKKTDMRDRSPVIKIPVFGSLSSTNLTTTGPLGVCCELNLSTDLCCTNSGNHITHSQEPEFKQNTNVMTVITTTLLNG